MVNLGTPENTNYISMWLYLREFLSDKRIIELTRLFGFQFYFYYFNFRPKSQENYMKKFGIKNKINPH